MLKSELWNDRQSSGLKEELPFVLARLGMYVCYTFTHHADTARGFLQQFVFVGSSSMLASRYLDTSSFFSYN